MLRWKGKIGAPDSFFSCFPDNSWLKLKSPPSWRHWHCMCPSTCEGSFELVHFHKLEIRVVRGSKKLCRTIIIPDPWNYILLRMLKPFKLKHCWFVGSLFPSLPCWESRCRVTGVFDALAAQLYEFEGLKCRVSIQGRLTMLGNDAVAVWSGVQRVIPSQDVWFPCKSSNIHHWR